MKRQSAKALALIALAVACGSTAIADTGQRSITVNGQAEVRVVPDEVILSLGVETFNVDLAEAKASNDSRTTAVREAAEALGVPRKLIQTEYISIEPEYRIENRARHFMHYRVGRTTVITLRDIDKFEALLSAVLDAGANYVHGVDFRTTELRKHRDHARALAIVAAKEKAEALTKELGESVGRVQKIQEGYAPWYSSYGSWWGRSRGGRMSQNVVQSVGASPGAAEGPTSPGQIAIDARVTVTFEVK